MTKSIVLLAALMLFMGSAFAGEGCSTGGQGGLGGGSAASAGASTGGPGHNEHGERSRVVDGYGRLVK